MISDPYQFIETYTGKQYFFKFPTPDMICIEDIAHALSNICRFTGHLGIHYSVATHSLLVASLVPQEHKLQALMHDATEAYVGDVASPLKRLLGNSYKELENDCRWAICEKYGLEFELPEIVKRADRHALYLEAKDLFDRYGKQIPDWWLQFKQNDMPEAPFSLTYKYKTIYIEEEFLRLFYFYADKKNRLA